MSPLDFSTKIVHSFSEVKDFLRDLGNPSSGKTRVYRGQTRSFINKTTGRDSLLPAILRPSGLNTYDPAWLATIAGFVGHYAKLDQMIDLATKQVWGPALLQHYGPGSSYLDVTSDIEIALWFSLHEWHDRWISLKRDGLGSAATTEVNTYTVSEMHVYTTWFTNVVMGPEDTDLPVVYVFDLDRWDGKGHPTHNVIV